MKQISPTRRCLIDNWSLKQVSVLLNDFSGQFNWHNYLTLSLQGPYRDSSETVKMINSNNEARSRMLISSFISLSNLINSIIFFDEVVFLKNGYEESWAIIGNLSNKLKQTHAVKCLSDKGNIESLISLQTQKGIDNCSGDKGLLRYWAISQFYNCELILSPQRSEFLLNKKDSMDVSYKELVNEISQTLDLELEELIISSRSNILKNGTLPNFTIPALTQLVLSKSKNIDDIFKTALEIRSLGKFKSFKNRINQYINEATTDTTQLTKFLFNDLKVIIGNITNELGINEPINDRSMAVGFSILFFSFAYNIYKPRRIKYSYLFLRDLASIRLDYRGIERHINRLFGIKYEDIQYMLNNWSSEYKNIKI